MAWILTLALMYPLVRYIGKVIDEVKYKEVCKNIENHNKANVFVCSVYVVAWNVYRDLEPQIIAAFEENNRDIYEIDKDDNRNFLIAVFGRDVYSVVYEEALKRVAQLPIQFYKLREGAWPGGMLEKNFDPIDANEVQKLDFKKEGDLWSTTGAFARAHDLPYLFNFQLAECVTNETVLSMVPSEYNPRNYAYYYKGKRCERPGTSEIFAELEKKQRNERVIKRTFNLNTGDALPSNGDDNAPTE